MTNRIGSRSFVCSMLLLGFADACGGQTDKGTSSGAEGASAGAAALANVGNSAAGHGNQLGAPAAGGNAAEMGPSASGSAVLPSADSGGSVTLPTANAGGAAAGPSANLGGNVTRPNTNYGGGGTAPSTSLLAIGGNQGTAAAGSNLFVAQNPSNQLDKIDILFMIDNSLGMGDKQLVLQASIPQLLHRLTNPDCVDPKGVFASVPMSDPFTPCGDPLQRAALPVRDIHIGIVTSSLGDFGGDTCRTPEEDPQGAANSPQNVAMNDRAWLLGALPRNAGALNSPFLTWGPAETQNYVAGMETKLTEFRNFVSATTELGCGFEMSLEAWYRFLVDPKPPTDVSPPLGPDGKVTSSADVRGPLDQSILDQRKEFLRPDSLLAVVILTDENDCSMRDDTYGWLAMTFGQGFRMWRGSSVCKEDPNNECCYSCMLDSSAPEKCKAMDTACRVGEAAAKLAASQDDLNIRCRQMKKRFGYDFLFPPSRYVNALTQTKLCPDQDYGDLDCECREAKRKNIPCNPGAAFDNPLYVNLNPKVVPTGPVRSGPDTVFLAGVVGVPWQDLAVNPTSATLEYQPATKLKWDLFAPPVDTDYSSVSLGDPLMNESFEPRPGLPGPDSPRWANPSNGHEWNTSGRDVQFACIFSLETEFQKGKAATHVCDLAQACGTDDGSPEYKKCSRRQDSCACTPTSPGALTQIPLDPAVTHSPLCQDSKNEFGNTQYFAKAQPGLRELQVLRGFYDNTLSDNAIVGSICPKDLGIGNQASPSFGYNPTMIALANAMQQKLVRACLPRALKIQADGTVPCSVIEVIPPSADRNWCNCEQNQRSTVSPEIASAIRSTMTRDAICGIAGLPACSDFCLCQLHEFTLDTPGSDRCLYELNVEKNSPSPGFCYVDPRQDRGSPSVVAGCPTSGAQLIRIVGNANSTNEQLAAPAPGKTYLACSAQ